MGTVPPPYDPRFQREQWRQQQRIAKEQARAARDAWRAQARIQREQIRWQTRGMRRSSIVGPILLVAVGVIFLLIQTGRVAATQFWGWYSHWWPLLLIGVGVLMLAEWVFDHYVHSEATPVRRSIGGVIFVVVLLALFSAGYTDAHNSHGFFAKVFHVNGEDWEQFVGDKHENDMAPIVQSFPEGGSLTVDNPRGDLTIAGTSDDGMIHITGHKEVYADSDSDAETKFNAIEPQIVTSGSNVVVNLPAQKGSKIDLEITVPASAMVTATTNRGELHVRNLKAAVSITANHGDVDTTAITGSVTVHVNNHDSSINAHSITGPLNIEGKMDEVNISDINGPIQLNGDVFGQGHMERIAGPLKMRTSRTEFQFMRLDGQVDIDPNHDMSIEQALGPIVLSTRNRDITMERVAGDITINNRNGSVELGVTQPLGNVSVTNKNGAVKVTVPDHTAFSVQAETSNGQAETDFPLSRQSNDHRGTLSGTVNGGGRLIRIVNSESDISVMRNTLMPLPPTPPAPPKITLEGQETVPPTLPGIDVRGSDGSRVIINKNGVVVRENNSKSTGKSAKSKQTDDNDF